MDKKGLIYVAFAVGIAYLATDHMNEKVNDLRVVNVNAEQASSEAISVQQFYPVLSLDTSDGGGERGSIDDAFFVAPPTPEPDDAQFVADSFVMEPLEASLDVVIVDIPPLPEPPPTPDPIEPINFLPDFAEVFRVQATMPEQRSVIMNGWAYQQGDKLPIALPVSYEDEYGNHQEEQLYVTLALVEKGRVLLTSETSAGWEQSLELTL